MAINGVFGPLFAVDPAEAAEPGSAEARSEALRAQHIVDVHTHFLRDDTRLMRFVDMRRDAAANGWNPALKGKPQTIEQLKFDNWFKEMFLDSDTKVELISGRSEAHTSELQSLMSISYAVFCLKKQKTTTHITP